MKCECCKEERKDGDFIKKYGECYKCVYRRKLGVYKERPTKNPCKVCGKICPKNRWSYCCEICSEEGARDRKREYWTIKLRKMEA
jgi:hypothetical protein